MKKLISVFLSLMLCVGLVGLVACTGGGSTNANVEYKVTVCVEDGTLLSGVEVRFYSNSRLQAVANTDENGVAKVELKAGEYVVNVRNFADTFQLDAEKTYTVSADQTEIEVELQVKTNDIKYKIEVQSFAGTPLNGIGVSVYKDGALVKSGTTKDGFVSFMLPSAVYDVKLTDIPAGYYESVDNAVYKTNYTGGLELGGETAIKLNTALIEEQAPANLLYGLGSVMYDFSIRLSDGTEFVLSEALEKYKAVYINFWATWCGPCVGEFPHIQKAYEEYSDDVCFLAISTTDANSAVGKFKADNGYTFAMCADNGFASHFDLSAGIPQTFVIDRYAVIADYHFGSFADRYEVVASFEKFTSDEYVPDPVLPPDGDDEGEVELVKPTYTMPSSADIQAAINGEGYTFGYFPEMNEYSWPWLIGEDEDGKYIYPSNKLISNSYAIIYSTVTITAGQVVAFDYRISSESNADMLYVQVDGLLTMEASGIGQGWRTCYAYVGDPLLSGTQSYDLSFSYVKDGGVSDGDDTVQIRNLRIVDEQAIVESGHSVDIRRYAAKGEIENDAGEVTSFASYITPVYNEDDGYYHVGEKNGPYLLADLLYRTPFDRNTSIEMYALEGKLVFDGFDYAYYISDVYGWRQSSSVIGYTPVTEELKQILLLITEEYGNGDQQTEWLELCCYFDHYGVGDPIEDPNRGITYEAAIQVYEGTSHLEMPLPIVPRGYKHVFVPEKSGVYAFYSLGIHDTFAFFSDKNQNIIATSQSNPYDTTNHNNFYYEALLRAGEPFYILTCFFNPGQFGEYDMVIEFVSEADKLLVQAATGPHTYDELGNIYVPDAIEVRLGDDGYMHKVNEDGTLDEGYVYLDMINTTEMFPEGSLKDILDNTPNRFDLSAYGGANWINEMKAYWQKAIDGKDTKDELYGLVAVDEKLYQIIQLFADKELEGSMNGWLLMCYYYENL